MKEKERPALTERMSPARSFLMKLTRQIRQKGKQSQERLSCMISGKRVTASGWSLRRFLLTKPDERAMAMMIIAHISAMT